MDGLERDLAWIVGQAEALAALRDVAVVGLRGDIAALRSGAAGNAEAMTELDDIERRLDRLDGRCRRWRCRG